MKITDGKVKSEYRSSIRSKAMIRKALLDLLEEKPFEKITITDIVRKADINRGTFYLHYRDISEVLSHIALSIIDELIEYIKKIDIEKIVRNPEICFIAISDFLEKDFDYYKSLIELDSKGLVMQESIRRGKAFLVKLLLSIKHVSTPFSEVAIDFLLAGTVKIYCDILMGVVPITLKEAPPLLRTAY